MIKASSFVISLGIILLLLCLINSFSITDVTPSLQRAEVLSSLSSVIVITIGIIWTNYTPNKPKKVKLKGKQGLYIENSLNNILSKELAWGSNLILTCTAASTILVYYNGYTLLKRGLISNSTFKPGQICINSSNDSKLISLKNLRIYPGREEFDTILEELPSIIIYPLLDKGWVIVGGWSERSFTIADEGWITGWSKKLIELLNEETNH